MKDKPLSALIILMGVSGCGKTTLGRALAAHLGWDFFDGDDFHPPENIAKMAAVIPLEDADRLPWLEAIHARMRACRDADRPAVFACSALRHSYRQILTDDLDSVTFIYLRGDFQTILSRMQARPGHFMQPAMLRSQFAALEEPSDGWVVDIRAPEAEIVDELTDRLRRADRTK
jgi:gluconokinase